ncbi:MAG: 16S rRNA (uracil(1498)-N(3))-methyltransferase [Firmicutes bacterium]|nr:16S rRNA (uracil(1498)-N(3))-methyltransferase [Bacillota bacterium]
MPKFFAEPRNMTSGRVLLTGGDAAHIARVLRGKAGDVHIIGDDRGGDYECEILEIGKNRDSVSFKILRRLPGENEPGVSMTLYQALPKLDKMDAIIQKCVELGVARVVPVITENTVVRTEAGGAARKRDRWQKIAAAAAKQSMRGIIPEIAGIVTLEEAVLGGSFGGKARGASGYGKNSAADYGKENGEDSAEDFSKGSAADSANGTAAREELRFAPYEGEKHNSVKSLLRQKICRSVGFFIGPEGGFSDSEARLFQENGIATVTLGPRILRTETAGATTLAMILYEWEL